MVIIKPIGLDTLQYGGPDYFYEEPVQGEDPDC